MLIPLNSESELIPLIEDAKVTIAALDAATVTALWTISVTPAEDPTPEGDMHIDMRLMGPSDANMHVGALVVERLLQAMRSEPLLHAMLAARISQVLLGEAQYVRDNMQAIPAEELPHRLN